MSTCNCVMADQSGQTIKWFSSVRMGKIWGFSGSQDRVQNVANMKTSAILTEVKTFEWFRGSGLRNMQENIALCFMQYKRCKVTSDWRKTK